MKEEIRKLWEICFDDTPAFVDLYFEKRYKEDINMAVYEEGHPVSALQMIPYPMTYFGETFPVSYISGACTHPTFRSKGYMGKLLDQTHQAMYERGTLMSVLIPAEEWLFQYYGRNGYVSSFNCQVKEIAVIEGKMPYGKTIKREDGLSIDPEVYSFFSRKTGERDFSILHPQEDLEVVLADLYLSGGTLWTIRSGNQVTGILFCILVEQTLWVKEALSESDEDGDLLLKEVAATIQARRVKEITSTSSESGTPKGMIRVINALQALSLYARHNKTVSVVIELSDKSLPINEGIYSISEGECHKRPSTPSGEQPIVMDATQLTRFFLGNDNPHMCLMLD